MTLHEAIAITSKALREASEVDRVTNWVPPIEHRAWQLVLEAAEQSLAPTNPPPSSPADLFDRLLLVVIPTIPFETADILAMSAVHAVRQLLGHRKTFLDSLVPTKEEGR